MSYNVKEVAEEFMLSPEELFEIFDVFFVEANEILERCAKAIVVEDYELLKKLFHAFKGSASNLRMTKMYDLLIQLECGAKLSNEELIIQKLSELQEETLVVRNQIAGFYDNK
jgi:HPt (histidine-containing phosphotransfer) domain-containing protein